MNTLVTDAYSTVMIGDHHTDLEVGRRAQVRTVFCEYGFGNHGQENPTLSIQEFSELLKLF